MKKYIDSINNICRLINKIKKGLASDIRNKLKMESKIKEDL